MIYDQNADESLELPDELRQLQTSLAQLKPSPTGTSAGNMLFAAGVTAGISRQGASTGPEKRLIRPVRWRSFLAGLGSGVLSAVIAVCSLSMLGRHSGDSVQSAEPNTQSDLLDPAAIETPEMMPPSPDHLSPSGLVSSEVRSLDRSPNRKTPGELDVDGLSPVMKRLWNRTILSQSELHISGTTSKFATHEQFSREELRKIAAEVL